MLYYDRIDLTKWIDPAKSNSSKESIICHYWSLNQGFKFQNSVCNSCHDLTMLCFGLSNIATITVKGIDHRYIIHDISKSKAIHLFENAVFDDRGYI